MDKILDAVKEDLNKNLVTFKPGDTISVGVKVFEGDKSRVQIFQGVVIAISSGSGTSKTFTVRKISNGVGVERIFPLHSPNLDSIKILKKGKVRRAKLYYLRGRKGKAAKIRELSSLDMVGCCSPVSTLVIGYCLRVLSFLVSESYICNGCKNKFHTPL